MIRGILEESRRVGGEVGFRRRNGGVVLVLYKGNIAFIMSWFFGIG